MAAGVACRHLAADGKDHGRLVSGPGDVSGAHRVAVHGRVVERRQWPLRGHIGGEDSAERVGQRKLTWRQRPDRRCYVGKVGLHGVHDGMSDVLGGGHRSLLALLAGL